MKLKNADRKIMRFVDGQRMRCLWYMPNKYYPEGVAETLSILKKIQRHGDLDAYKKAGKLICQLQRSKG